MKQEGYFKEMWNLFDYSLIVVYFGANIIEFTAESADGSRFLMLAQVFIVILSFLKINFFLRIYDGFSFLVSMMGGVFQDIKYFVAFFMIIIFQFGIIFAILFNADYDPEYAGVG